MIALVGKFLKSTGGVFATEFALVAPLMLTVWVGIVEMTSAHLVARKVEVAAQSVADLIAQHETITNAQLTDIVSAIDAILYPYPDLSAANAVGYNISRIEADGVGSNSVVLMRAGGPRTVANPPATLANTLNTNNDSVIVVTIEYEHQWVVFSTLFTAITLTETAIARPRLVPIIPLLP